MTTMKQWKVTGKGGFSDLKLEENVAIPEIGDKEVLVKRKFVDNHPIDHVGLKINVKSTLRP